MAFKRKLLIRGDVQDRVANQRGSNFMSGKIRLVVINKPGKFKTNCCKNPEFGQQKLLFTSWPLYWQLMFT